LRLDKIGLAAFVLLALLRLRSEPGGGRRGEGCLRTSRRRPSISSFSSEDWAIFFYKPVPPILEKKGADVKNALDEPRPPGPRPRDGVSRPRRGLDGIAAEAERMKAEATSRGRTEKDRIARAAEEEGARLKQFAAREIDLQTRAAVRELRTYAAETATAIAGNGSARHSARPIRPRSSINPSRGFPG